MPIPTRVYIFDGVDASDLTSMNDRVARCYAWAKVRGATVVDEVISWAPRDSAGRQVALTHAVAACRRDRAALLIYSDDVLPLDRQALAWLSATSVLAIMPGSRVAG